MRRVLSWMAFLLCVFTASARAGTLTASDVLSRARVYLRDQQTSANGQQFPDATLLQFLSDGVREANAQNWLLQSSTTFNLSLGTTEYAMPSDFMATMRVWFRPPGGSFLKLDATSMDQLDAQSAGWINVKGLPTRYYLDRSTNTINLGFYPAPAVANSTGPVIVYYVSQPPEITATGSLPFNGNYILQPYVSALSYYVAYRGWLTLEEPDLADKYFQLWVAFIGMMRQGTTKTPDYNPGFIGQHGSP